MSEFMPRSKKRIEELEWMTELGQPRVERLQQMYETLNRVVETVNKLSENQSKGFKDLKKRVEALECEGTSEPESESETDSSETGSEKPESDPDTESSGRKTEPPGSKTGSSRSGSRKRRKKR